MQTIWGIHGGKTGDAHSLFLNKNVVAVGWPAMGDLSAIPPNREAFKAAVAKTYPQHKPGAIPNNAGCCIAVRGGILPAGSASFPETCHRSLLCDRHDTYGRELV
jgi:restriction system protein